MTLHTLVHSCDSSHTIVILFIPLCQLWSKSFLILSLPIIASVYKLQWCSIHIHHLLLVQQCDYIYQNKYLQVYIRTSVFVSFETNETNAFQSTLVCWPIMQQGEGNNNIYQQIKEEFYIDIIFSNWQKLQP